MSDFDESHAVDLLCLLEEMSAAFDDGDAELAEVLAARAAELCAPGAPPLSAEAAAEATRSFARCEAARLHLEAQLVAAQAALGTSQRAFDAYER